MIVNITKAERTSVKAESIRVDTVFKGRIGAFDSVFLRTAQGIVDLQNPLNVWSYTTSGMNVDFYEDAQSAVLNVTF